MMEHFVKNVKIVIINIQENVIKNVHLNTLVIQSINFVNNVMKIVVNVQDLLNSIVLNANHHMDYIIINVLTVHIQFIIY